MFYHISQQKGLTELEPRVSTHKKAWVYALKDPKVGLVFAGRDNLGNKADDCFTQYGINSGGIPEIFELYDGCFNDIFKGKDCYIYELEDSGFKDNQTSWAPEWVSTKKTNIVGCRYIKDILEEIENLEKSGKFIIHRFQHTKNYQEFVEKRIRHVLYRNKSGWINIATIKHFYNIVQEYANETINENFQKGFENFSKIELKEAFEKFDSEYNGCFIRKEMVYLYPKEVKNWVDKKYENQYRKSLAKDFESDKIFTTN